MQTIEQQTRGVLHLADSQSKYQLQRYAPCDGLKQLVEVYWTVNWQLGDTTHLQQNIPHPSCNLTLENGEFKLYGPVSKTFSYPLTGEGSITGVKFTPAGFYSFYQRPLSALLDMALPVGDVMPTWQNGLCQLSHLTPASSELVQGLENFLLHQQPLFSDKQHQVNQWLQQIESNPELTRVEHLEHEFQQSKRQLQRVLQHYVGLSPKWILRKYRMHQALDKLEADNFDLQQLLLDLDYSDQSHFIRDFKSFTGTTPRHYQLKN